MHSDLSFGRKTLKFEADTLFHTNLNLNCQNLPNVSYTHKFLCVTMPTVRPKMKKTDHQIIDCHFKTASLIIAKLFEFLFASFWHILVEYVRPKGSMQLGINYATQSAITD